MSLTVAGYQMAVTKDIDANTSKLLAAIEQSAEAKADILLTPEGSLSGYTPRFDVTSVRSALDTVTKAAIDQSLALALGTCFIEADGQCYNQIRFYEADGTFKGFHSKILRCGSHDSPPTGEINNYATTDLQTFDVAGHTVGALICNDLWANPGCTPMPDPHLTQQLSKMGAQVIFHAVNGGRSGGEGSKVAWQFHESNLRMRSRAGKIWTVTADSAEPTTIPCSAPSGVIDPEGGWACQTDDTGEAFFVHPINFS